MFVPDSIRSLVDSTTYQLTYFDPDVNLTKTCSTSCSLSKNTNVLYQDFRITNISITNGIAIDINSWYGVSGGLASVKVFQSGMHKSIYIYIYIKQKRF